MARLTAQQLQRLYAARAQAGASPRTVRHIHAVMHKVLADAERLDIVARNVANLVTLPRMERQERPILS